MIGKCFMLVKDLKEIEGFDPHRILGIDKKAKLKDVKKAYRKLAKTMHPDKNPDNPNAVDDFNKITKAHGVSKKFKFSF